MLCEWGWSKPAGSMGSTWILAGFGVLCLANILSCGLSRLWEGDSPGVGAGRQTSRPTFHAGGPHGYTLSQVPAGKGNMRLRQIVACIAEPVHPHARPDRHYGRPEAFCAAARRPTGRAS